MQDNKLTEEEHLAMSIADRINDILAHRGIYDGGKNFTTDVQERIMPLISQIATERYKRGDTAGQQNMKDRVLEVLGKMYESAKDNPNLPSGKYTDGYKMGLTATVENVLSFGVASLRDISEDKTHE